MCAYVSIGSAAIIWAYLQRVGRLQCCSNLEYQHWLFRKMWIEIALWLSNRAVRSKERSSLITFVISLNLSTLVGRSVDSGQNFTAASAVSSRISQSVRPGVLFMAKCAYCLCHHRCRSRLLLLQIYVCGRRRLWETEAQLPMNHVMQSYGIATARAVSSTADPDMMPFPPHPERLIEQSAWSDTTWFAHV